ncbi:MAG: maleylacetoacetate isomerase [Burkholderiaceae bacterium]
MLKLYTYFRSSAAYRVRIALNLKGLAFEPEVIWLPAGEQSEHAYTDVNPQALVPTLIDGDLTVAQSLAILEYLDERYPQRPLLPTDIAGRARVRSLALLVACDIHPINNLRILKYLRGALGQGEEAVNAWYRHWCDAGLSAYERELERGPGPYSHGDAVTIADCCLVPQVFNAQRFDVDMSRYPRVMAVNDACLAQDAFARAAPMAQPEAGESRG